MTVQFLLPVAFVLLFAVAALVAFYVVMQQRRREYAVRFTNLELLSSVAPRRPGWRRHVPAGGVALALVFLVIGLAQPVHSSEVANESKIIMLTIDVSRSMEATDVAPSRLAAAKTAAVTFVEGLPDGVDVGLVAFDGSASLLAAPTADHERVAQAISTLESGDGTATGEGIMASLPAIQVAREAAGLTQPTDESAAIVLLSDGMQQLGIPLEAATQRAVAMQVPISTITYGTDEGTVTIESGLVVQVPPDPVAMAAVAEATGGVAFDAASADQLNQVLTQIQGDVGTTVEQTDLWQWFVAIAFVLLVLASAGAILWNGRFL